MARRLLPLSMILVLLALGLAACGESTATPVPPPTATPTTAPPTATPTTVAPTTTTTTSAAATAGSSGGTSLVPSYPGATAVTIPDVFRQQVEPSLTSQVKNGKIEAYKTSDAATKIKSFYTDTMTKNGWNDITANAAGATSQFEAFGGFFALYQQGVSAAGVIALPGLIGSQMGFSGVTSSDTVILVISGSAI